MNDSQFFSEYANTPLEDLFIPLNVTKAGLTTLNGLNDRIRELNRLEEPYEAEKRGLLKLAEDYFIAKHK